MVKFDRSAFIGKFREEAAEYLQRLNEGVITLEQRPDDRELIQQMLRDAHTLKGSSRMVGLMEISDIAHRLEDVMVSVRDGGLEYMPDMSDPFFEALDAIVHLAEHAGEEGTAGLDVQGLLSRLSALAGTAESDELNGEPAEAADEGDEEAQPAKHVVEAQEETEAGREEQTADEPGEGASPKGGQPQRAQRDDSLKARAQPTIRIRTEQVDHMLNLVGEVVISQIKAERSVADIRAYQSTLEQAVQTWQRLKRSLAGLEVADDVAYCETIDELTVLDSQLVECRRHASALSRLLSEDVSRSSTVISDLQEHVMRLRMLPVSTVFDGFPRAVRDLAKSFKKEIELVVEGGDTELDKKVLEEINDPLIHIIRNAVDHGIEAAEARAAAGKPAKGTVHLSACQEGDHILIEVADDGGGIDPAAVRAAAIRKGYLTEQEASAMSDREATYMIFEAGFSTSSIITEISGRGVGMDVVREFIVEKLKGSLDVESELGQGTTFRLRIPLTLAIIRALMLRVGGQLFAMPTAVVDETLRVDAAEVLKVEGREVIRRQRRTVTLVRLSDILGVPADNFDGSRKIPVAIVGFSGHRMGFAVDAFAGEQQIVIKNLGSHLHRVDNVAGVTVLGAGEVVPILNVPDLMTNARSRVGTRQVRAAKEDREGPRRILICEDSFTTRELERSIFEAAGYAVEAAVDGAIGLQLLKGGLAADAVVTDVQMPNMTGFELTRAIKSDPRLQSIPVVIVTSLERDEEKAEGVEAGADAYITKSVFNQDTLLDTVERLIR